VHGYLGCDYNFSKTRRCESYYDQVQLENLGGLPEKITKAASSPASKHLFTVCDGDDPSKWYLGETKAMQFHHFTAQLLLVSQREWYDLQMAVSFLTTKVKKPDENDR